MYDVYGFIRGPMVWLTFAVFIGGLIYQARNFYRFTSQVSLPTPPPSVLGPSAGIGKFNPFVPGNMVFFSDHPFFALLTIVFHLSIIILPLFLSAHNVLLGESFGFSLFTLPAVAADLLTLLVIFCGVLFLLRRVFIARVRAISTLYDYMILALVIAPFLTGYLATRQVFDYDTMIVLHILSGELMLVAVPFTKLRHGLLFFLYRYLLHYEHSLGRGSRTWSYGQAK
jgi:nitrate reductase gamma subunit